MIHANFEETVFVWRNIDQVLTPLPWTAMKDCALRNFSETGFLI
jgi:hypothetical protein